MFTYYTSHCAFMSQSRFNTMVNDWSSHLSIAASIWCWGGGGDNGCGYGLSRETENQTPLSLDVIITPLTTAVLDSQRPRVNDWTYGVFYETSLSTFLSMNHHQVLYLKKKWSIPLSQLFPAHPSIHLHVPLTHLPLPEHWPGQSKERKDCSISFK